MNLIPLLDIGMELDIDDPFKDRICFNVRNSINYDIMNAVYDGMERVVKQSITYSIVAPMEGAVTGAVDDD